MKKTLIRSKIQKFNMEIFGRGKMNEWTNKWMSEQLNERKNEPKGKHAIQCFLQCKSLSKSTKEVETSKIIKIDKLYLLQ